MASIKRGLKFLFTNRALFLDTIVRKFLVFLPDKLFLSLRYRCVMGHWVNWKAPKSFSEKIQWLKVYDRRPEYVSMVDKYAVKQYVSQIIGEEYIIPTLGKWDDPNMIDWDILPNQFVLKTTHSGGGCGVIICKDKSDLNKEETIRLLQLSLTKGDIYSSFREWPYANVPRCVIAEEFLVQSENVIDKDLPDYKFFCFNGEPIYCQVIRDRKENKTVDFYDMEWTQQEFVGTVTILAEKKIELKNGTNPVLRPKHLSKMKEICRKLSNNIPFVRIDLYVVDDRVYFGEMTFYPASGFGVFTPIEWHHKLGELIDLTPLSKHLQ